MSLLLPTNGFYSRKMVLIRFYKFLLTTIPVGPSELNVDNWNDNCEAKSEAKSPRPLCGLQVDFSLTRNVSYAVR